MKEEDKLLRKVGTTNPFTVPEGYFENLTSEVMNRLPEKEKTEFSVKKVTLWDRVKPWAYMAAMFAGAALIIRIASSNQGTDKSVITEKETSEAVSDQYIDAALDHSMMDDYSLYVYLADESVV